MRRKKKPGFLPLFDISATSSEHRNHLTSTQHRDLFRKLDNKKRNLFSVASDGNISSPGYCCELCNLLGIRAGIQTTSALCSRRFSFPTPNKKRHFNVRYNEMR